MWALGEAHRCQHAKDGIGQGSARASAGLGVGILAAPDVWAIIDPWTTDTDKDNDPDINDPDIIDIVAIDSAGRVLFTSMVRPSKPVHAEVAAKTRITDAQAGRAQVVGMSTTYEVRRACTSQPAGRLAYPDPSRGGSRLLCLLAFERESKEIGMDLYARPQSLKQSRGINSGYRSLQMFSALPLGNIDKLKLLVRLDSAIEVESYRARLSLHVCGHLRPKTIEPVFRDMVE